MQHHLCVNKLISTIDNSISYFILSFNGYRLVRRDCDKRGAGIALSSKINSRLPLFNSMMLVKFLILI